jgi:hypothetical protein
VTSNVNRWLLVLLLLSFGLSFGLNCGTSNQAIYLLPAVRALHPETWARDWVVTQTHVYHPAYAKLATLLLRLSPTGYLIGSANVCAIALGMFAIWRLLHVLDRPERALAALCIVLLLSSVTRTQGPGGTYAFSEIFQPSTLGALGVIAAMVAFVAGEALASGLCLAFAGIFHVNYLVLALAVFGLGWLASGREHLARKLGLGLGPPLIVLLYFVPFLLASAAPTVSTDAQRIYVEVRAPHHYMPARFAWDFAPWLGFQLLGLAALLGPVRRGSDAHRRVLILLGAAWLLVISAVLLSTVVTVRPVQELMAWRICPEATLLAQSSFALACVALFCEGKSALVGLEPLARTLSVLGVLAMLVGSIATRHWNATLVVLALCVAVAIVTSGVFGAVAGAARGTLPLAYVSGGLLIALAGANALRFAELVHVSNLLSGVEPGVAELCAWARKSTPENALFLTPPQEDEIRFQCRRAIVVDWKSNPAVPSEVLEWYDRIENVTAQHPFQREADLDGYQKLDQARVAALRERYGFDYVVVERGHEIPTLGRPVFSGQRFAAYALSPREHYSSRNTLKR